MSTKRRWIVLAALPLLFMGCKKKEPTPPPPPTGPAAPQQPQPQPANRPDPHAYGPPAGAGAAAGWPHRVPPDLGPPDAGQPATKQVKAVAIASDADIAKYKEDKAKQETEKAVESSVNGALTQVKTCLDRYGTASGQHTLKVRVHRSGRVLSSSVSGANAAANTCVQGVLSRLRVSGMQTDTIDVERKLNYAR